MKNFLLLLACVLYGNVVASQNTLKWTFKSQSGIYSSPIIDDNRVYFGSNDSVFYALDKKTGKEYWTYHAFGAIKSKAVFFQNLVLFHADNGRITAVERTTGELVWQFSTDGEKVLDIWDYYMSAPVVDEGVVYFGSGDQHVYALNARTGALLWKYKTSGIVHASPIIHKNKLLIGSFDGYFYALDKKEGSVIWKFKTIGDKYFPKGEIQKAACIYNDKVIFGSRDYNIYALDINAGTGHWNYKERGSWIIATPTVSGNDIYFGTSDTHRFYCMDARSGEIKWEVPLNMRVYAGAVINNNHIFFPCFNGKMYNVDMDSGNYMSIFQTKASASNYLTMFKSETHFVDGLQLYGEDMLKIEKEILGLGALLSTPCLDDNILFFGDANGYFYALDVSEH